MKDVFFIFVISIFSATAAAAGGKRDLGKGDRRIAKGNACALYLGGPGLLSNPLAPHVLIVPEVEEKSVVVPGFGGPVDEIINISGLHILNPSFSLHLGAMTHEEATHVATNITAEGGDWRLPAYAELMALQENGFWKFEELFRLNTVWVNPASEIEREDRDQLVYARSHSGNTPHMVRLMASHMVAAGRRDEYLSRYAFNLITGRSNFIPSVELRSTKFPALFVRSPQQ